MVAMAWGVWLGLLRLGWNLRPYPADLLPHGPLMVGGFLGTLIGLERAVGLGAWWAYAGPILTASGAAAMVLGAPSGAAPALVTLGSLVLVAIFAVVLARQPTLFSLVMALGAIAWCAGNVHWFAGASIYRVVLWWVAFLVLTIAGERLELTRVLRPKPGVRRAFLQAMTIFLGGVVAAVRWPDEGARATGVGLLLLAWWLARHDVARRTVRQTGLTRFIAVCLLSGYAWLGFAGATLLATGQLSPGPRYDAVLHALFLGFAISMVFGHAPVIFPAVLRVELCYRSAFYIHLAALHGALAVRVTGDLVPELGRWRVWGGLLNAIALLLFVVNTARSVRLR
jgi:hypothetical protein